MRSIKYIAFAFGASAFILSGCSDSFLDKTPDERVEINTPTKCVQLLNTAYPEGSYGFAKSPATTSPTTTLLTILPTPMPSKS